MQRTHRSGGSLHGTLPAENRLRWLRHELTSKYVLGPRRQDIQYHEECSILDDEPNLVAVWLSDVHTMPVKGDTAVARDELAHTHDGAVHFGILECEVIDGAVCFTMLHMHFAQIGYEIT